MPRTTETNAASPTGLNEQTRLPPGGGGEVTGPAWARKLLGDVRSSRRKLRGPDQPHGEAGIRSAAAGRLLSAV